MAGGVAHFDCRPGCGACCIAPSISTAFPGHPQGKPAGEPCAQLDDQYRCRLWGDPGRPAVCAQFPADPEHCGANRDEAIAILDYWELVTR